MSGVVAKPWAWTSAPQGPSLGPGSDGQPVPQLQRKTAWSLWQGQRRWGREAQGRPSRAAVEAQGKQRTPPPKTLENMQADSLLVT